MPRINVPKTRASNKWSEAKYWSFIRSALRRAWLRWPARYTALAAVKRPYVGPKTQRKFSYICTRCAGEFAGTDVQVHHKQECGSLKSFSDLPQFVERLLCEAEHLEVLCTKCHKDTHSQ